MRTQRQHRIRKAICLTYQKEPHCFINGSGRETLRYYVVETVPTMSGVSANEMRRELEAMVAEGRACSGHNASGCTTFWLHYVPISDVRRVEPSPPVGVSSSDSWVVRAIYDEAHRFFRCHNMPAARLHLSPAAYRELLAFMREQKWHRDPNAKGPLRVNGLEVSLDAFKDREGVVWAVS